MKVWPASRFVAVHAPRGAYWKRPPLPLPAQRSIDPSPAPMSDETTAMWRLGAPPGSARSVSMNIGKAATRLACADAIDDESSTTNNTSTSRFPGGASTPVTRTGGTAASCLSCPPPHASASRSANARPDRTLINRIVAQLPTLGPAGAFVRDSGRVPRGPCTLRTRKSGSAPRASGSRDRVSRRGARRGTSSSRERTTSTVPPRHC